MNFLQKILSALGMIAILIVIGFGTVWAYTRGGNDFNVFYEAWRLVLSGKGADIYRVSPDRFLYSPGFAWLLSPLGLLPRAWSLGIWCAIKIFLVLFLILRLGAPEKGKSKLISWGIAAWGCVLIARPLLIDLEYGQVNLLILGACVWALLGHFDRKVSAFWDTFRWIVMTFAAIAKLYPIPMLLVPWCVTKEISPQKLKSERWAIVLGAVICLAIPLLSEGFQGTLNLMVAWREAVLARGLPLESHNQSFTALLYHYLSGQSTAVLSEGARPLFFGRPWLGQQEIVLLSFFWTFSTLGITLGWIVSGPRYQFWSWCAVLVGFLIIPSHLIWKPYFVMSIPMAIWIVQQAIRTRKLVFGFLISALFIGINLTGFDFIGHSWSAQFEAASVLLLTHLALILTVLFTEKESVRVAG